MPGKDGKNVKQCMLILLVLLAAAAAGCTIFGEPFDDPSVELSIIGGERKFCKDGRALIFGHVRNTGELEARDITAVASVFDGGGGFLGSFKGPVTESVEEIDVILVDDDGNPILDEEGNEIVVERLVIPIDTLDVDESGSFSVETTVGCNDVARSEVTFEFTFGVFSDEELQ